jgi:hypothetical protein
MMRLYINHGNERPTIIVAGDSAPRRAFAGECFASRAGLAPQPPVTVPGDSSSRVQNGRQARGYFAMVWRRSSPHRSRRRAFGVVAMCLSAWLAGASIGRAALGPSAGEDIAQQYVGARIDLWRAEAELAILPEEKSPDAPSKLPSALNAIPADWRSQIIPILAGAIGSLSDELEKLLAGARQTTQALADAWEAVRGKLNDATIDIESSKGVGQASGKAALFFGKDQRGAWVWATVALLTVTIVIWHDRRHDFRQLTNGGRPRSRLFIRALQLLVVGMVAITLLMLLAGDWVHERLIALSLKTELTPTERLQAEADSWTRKAEEEEVKVRQARELRRAKQEQWATDLGMSEAQIAEAWKSTLQQLVALLAEVRMQRLAEVEWRNDDKEFAGQDAEALSARATQIERRFQENLSRAVVTSSLTAIVGVVALVYVRNSSRDKRRRQNTCPLCLSVNSLESKERPDAQSGRLQMMVCTARNEASPTGRCNFRFLRDYQQLEKLCFPTLGIPSSGKTHWLAMVYRELNRGNHPEQVKFERIKSSSSDEFDRLVSELIDDRIRISATQPHALPSPLLFNFRDHDPIGRSNVLVNIFDYSGEILRKSIADPHRQRALQADGYLFFLDPTRPSDEQAKALVDFREDVRAVRKVRVGKAVRSPVALCVSKIDLMVNEGYSVAGKHDPIDQFYRDLAAVDPTRQELSLRAIRARSRLVRNLRDVVWPGWNVDQQIHDLFGGRCMYFPLTPVGLNELGETDLSRRVIDPFAILEPLLWLIHMNGYPVLS